jgi:hypothetical protein
VVIHRSTVATVVRPKIRARILFDRSLGSNDLVRWLRTAIAPILAHRIAVAATPSWFHPFHPVTTPARSVCQIADEEIMTEGEPGWARHRIPVEPRKVEWKSFRSF